MATCKQIINSYALLKFHDELKESNLLKYDGNLYEEINQNLQQIMPSNGSRKRGLIDGLGTIIKYIFGNLHAKNLHRINKYLELFEN